MISRLFSKRPLKRVSCGHQSDPTDRKCPECQIGKERARKYRWKIIAGLLLPFSLASLDTTLIASALPAIAGEFDELRNQNWIVSAFNLTGAAFIPFWGSMCDIFGRYAALQASTIIMLLGSAICTGSPVDAFPVMLLGRALQGIACAGLVVIIRVILADKVSLRESSVNWSIFTFFGGIAFGLGPVIGGYLTLTSWRWCFAINLPIGVAGVILVALVIRKDLLGPQPLAQLAETTETGRRTRFMFRLRTVDFWGQGLFLLGCGLMVLALTWAGATYAWNSAAVLISLIAGIIMTLLWVIWQFLMSPGHVLGERWPWKHPMIQWKVLSDRNIGLLFYTSVATGMAQFGVFYFCSIYFAIVKLVEPEETGVKLLFFTPGMAVGVYLGSFMVNGWPRVTWSPIMLGTVIEAIGIGLLAWALYKEDEGFIYGMMALTGVGTGLRVLCVLLHGIGMFPDNIAPVVALMTVAPPLGGTIGHTIMSTVFNNLAGIGEAHDLFDDLEDLKKLTPDQFSDVAHTTKMAVVWAYVALMPFMLVCIVAAALLGTIILPKSGGSEETRNRNVVIEEPYLWYLLRGEGTGERLESTNIEMDSGLGKKEHGPAAAKMTD